SPASGLKGPSVSRRAASAVLAPVDARRLLDSIDGRALVDLRDRALLATIFYSFGRASAVVSMKVGDFRVRGERAELRLSQGDSRSLWAPAHPEAAANLAA